MPYNDSGAPILGPLELSGVGFVGLLKAGADDQKTPAVRGVWTTPVDRAIRDVVMEMRVVGDTDVSRATQRPSKGKILATNGVIMGADMECRLVPVPMDPNRKVKASTWQAVSVGTTVAGPNADDPDADTGRLVTDFTGKTKAYWAKTGGGVTHVASTAEADLLDVVRGIQFAAAGITASVARAAANNGSARPIEKGGYVRAAADIWKTAGFNGRARIAITWRNRNGVDLSTDYINGANHQGVPLAVAAEERLDGKKQAPAAARTAVVAYEVDWGSTVGRAGLALMSNFSAKAAERKNTIEPKAIQMGVGGHLTLEDGVSDATDAGLVTAVGTAAAITGQGALATVSTVLNAHLGAGAVSATKWVRADNASMVDDSEFADAAYWTFTAATWTINSADAEVITLGATRALKSDAGNGTMVQGIGFAVVAAGQYAPVQTGETLRLKVRALYKAGFTGLLSLRADFYDRANVLVSSVTASGTDYRTVAVGGADVQAVISYKAPVPAGAKFVRFGLQLNWSTTQNNAGRAYVAEPRMWPVIKLGAGGGLVREDGTTEGTDAALVTASGTAAAIAGQGALATKGNVDLASGTDVLNRTAVNITWSAGGTVQSLKPGEAGANVTESRTAAAITGQGALATKSSVAHGDVDYAGLKPSRMARVGIRGNVIDDFNFLDTSTTDNAAYWYLFGPGTVISTDATYVIAGLKVPRALYAVPQGNGAWMASAFRESVEGGADYRLRLKLYYKAGYNGRVNFVLEWFDAAGGLISQTIVTGTDYRAPLAALGADLLTALDATVTAPADAATVRAYIHTGSTGTAPLPAGGVFMASPRLEARPELTDGRIAAGLDTAGDLNRNITSARADSSNLLRRTAGGLFTGDLDADKTSTHTAAGIASQGALATLSIAPVANGGHGANNAKDGRAALGLGGFTTYTVDADLTYVPLTHGRFLHHNVAISANRDIFLTGNLALAGPGDWVYIRRGLNAANALRVKDARNGNAIIYTFAAGAALEWVLFAVNDANAWIVVE